MHLVKCIVKQVLEQLRPQIASRANKLAKESITKQNATIDNLKMKIETPRKKSTITFHKKGCKEQHKINTDVINKMDDALDALDENDMTEAKRSQR